MSEEDIQKFLAKGGKIKKFPFNGSMRYELDCLTPGKKKLYGKLRKCGFSAEEALQEAKGL